MAKNTEEMIKGLETLLFEKMKREIRKLEFALLFLFVVLVSVLAFMINLQKRLEHKFSLTKNSQVRDFKKVSQKVKETDMAQNHLDQRITKLQNLSQGILAHLDRLSKELDGMKDFKEDSKTRWKLVSLQIKSLSKKFQALETAGKTLAKRFREQEKKIQSLQKALQSQKKKRNKKRNPKK